MADIDTGLGWYADEDWLANQSGETIATLSTGGGGGSSYLDEPYFAKVSTGGVIMVTLSDNRTVYVRNDSPSDMYYCVYYIDSTNLSAMGIFYENSDGLAYMRVGSSGRWNEVLHKSYTTYSGDCSTIRTSYFSGAAIYYITQAPIPILYPITEWGVPNADGDTLLNYMVNHFSFDSSSINDSGHVYNKSTAGYSITCSCKWRTSYGGDVYFSPVLISSEQNNTLYTRDGSTPSVNVTEHQYGGMTFYMRKAPLDTLDGSETITSNYPIVDLSGVAQTNDTIFAAIAYQSSLGVGYIPGDEDPYAGGGTSKPGGGGGAFDNTSDQIVDSTIPTFSFASSGFCRIYNPTLSQLQNLANYLWTDTNFLQTIVNHAKQLLEDPIEAVISLAMLPVAIPQGASETVKVLFISTGVSMPPATTQYVDVDCGTYFLDEHYGSALDYNPYTQVDLFLPFIGQVSLNTDEVMGHTIGVKYRVDIVSGLCVAKVFVDDFCMYQFSGNCAIFMPLNSADFSSYLSAAMTAATALVSAGAGAAAGAAAAGAEAVAEPAIQTGGNLLTSGESLVTPQMALQYRVEESVRPMYSPSGSEGSPSASFGEMERKFVSNSAAAVMGSKISFEHASHLAGNSGILGVRRPYLIINRPDMCNPKQYGKYNGRPCMVYLYLGNLTGYTEVQEIQLTGFSATNPELSEISKMLKGGVIL